MYAKLVQLDESICKRIANHPYNKELFAGSLPKEVFDDYLQKDIVYLRVFSKALDGLAGRVPKKWRPQFEKISKDIVEYELGMHHGDLLNNPFSEEKAYANSPNNAARIKYTALIENISAPENADKYPLVLVLCALAPCFTTYAYMGRTMTPEQKYGNQPNHYLTWVSFYKDQAFIDSKNALMACIKELSLSEDLTDEQVQDCLLAFSISGDCEYNLYSSSYNSKGLRIGPESLAEYEPESPQLAF